MATFFYGKALEKFLDGLISWSGDDFKILFADATYVPDADADEFVSTVGGAELPASRSANLSGKTIAAGVADADDVVLSAVTAGGPAVAIVLFKDSGTDATSPLLAYIDNYAGLPILFNGSDVTVVFPADANRIFKL